MSHKANFWLASLEPSRVKSGAFRVLFHLCDHHNMERDPMIACYPSQETLRERTGLSNGALNDALSAMEEEGLLIRRRSTVPGTSERRTYYILGCDFDLLPEQTPENGVSPNSGGPETAEKQTPVLGQANSSFDPGKLRCTGEDPFKNLLRTSSRERSQEEEVSVSDEFLGEVAGALGVDLEAGGKWWQGPQAKAHIRRWLESGLSEKAILSICHQSREANPNPPEGPKALDHLMLPKPVKGKKPQAARKAATTEEVTAFWAEKINAGSWIPPNAVSPAIASALWASGLVSAEKLRAAGIRR
ncbi:MarR family transcriptional regulator [Pseudogemmobacter faecipullorum]|uniref:MarR family transcriptional regulator n=1 Tax=Pseudogemmobacter faecipullorum TaxID=2755041 RepID=A0ABS8CQ50_9RHOB|nr:helix-turn-helix domain-containing protein [Pseudogemmobacter faecipullorum]MCB5411494.1 MarR family transcriptional regulator [Pseudogemmobacter faecipullorum]